MKNLGPRCVKRSDPRASRRRRGGHTGLHGSKRASGRPGAGFRGRRAGIRHGAKPATPHARQSTHRQHDVPWTDGFPPADEDHPRQAHGVLAVRLPGAHRDRMDMVAGRVGPVVNPGATLRWVKFTRSGRADGGGPPLESRTPEGWPWASPPTPDSAPSTDTIRSVALSTRAAQRGSNGQIAESNRSARVGACSGPGERLSRPIRARGRRRQVGSVIGRSPWRLMAHAILPPVVCRIMSARLPECFRIEESWRTGPVDRADLPVGTWQGPTAIRAPRGRKRSSS